MPELPEVELVARSLNELTSGRRIETAELRRQRLAPALTPNEFAALLAGSTINRIHRRGKHILFDLSHNRTLIVHLRMSGRFSVRNSDTDDPKFTHAVFYFEDGARLVFDDQRHFGFMKIVDTPDLYEAKELKHLAPEPFSTDFSAEYLYRSSRSIKRSLKEFLLDQTKVCGLGNIYACEAMFASGLNPRLAARRLSRQRATSLHGSILDTLGQAIDFAARVDLDPADLEGGYFNGSGVRGWCVYDREGTDCIKCASQIARIRQGGRSTYYCKQCQCL